MNYKSMNFSEFTDAISTNAQAIEYLWEAKTEGRYRCSECGHQEFYSIKQRPEIRQCKKCKKDNRVRVGTVFENTKIPILKLLRHIFFVSNSKRGISALEFKRHVSSQYGSTWSHGHRIRHAMMERDKGYQLQGSVELDGAEFGRRENENNMEALIAVSFKKITNKNGKEKHAPVFAKIELSPEQLVASEAFIKTHIQSGAQIFTDGAKNYTESEIVGYTINSRPMYNDPLRLEKWLPAVHKLISNIKAFLIGTYHGVRAKYLKLYLSEYLYRFNRRFSESTLFDRAVRACCLCGPIKMVALLETS